jgi:hypothetical protein
MMLTGTNLGWIQDGPNREFRLLVEIDFSAEALGGRSSLVEPPVKKCGTVKPGLRHHVT